MNVITLVAAAPPLGDDVISDVLATLRTAGIEAAKTITWLCPGKAAAFRVAAPPDLALIHNLQSRLAPPRVDIFSTPQDSRRKKLLLADMDATIVAGETLDDMAARAGIGPQIAAITAQAMNGDLDFRQALTQRVALLAGKSEALLQQVLDSGSLNPGAEIFVRAMRRHGAKTVLVSGGFTFFTAAYAQRVGFDHHHGNTLGSADGKLTGRIDGDILDKDSKRAYLQQYCIDLGIAESEALAIGDGANDLPMLHAAGLGIGYRPKTIVRNSVANCIIHGDLTAALYAQGYWEGEFYD